MKKQTRPETSARERVWRSLDRGTRLLEQGKAQEAIPHLERAHRFDPDSVPILINLGGAYAMAGRHREAIPLLESARQMEPDNAMIWINLAAAYLGNPVIATSEQQMRAIAAFEKALDLNPAAPNVHYNLGLIFVERGEADLALAAFREAIRLNPSDRDARYWLRKLKAEDERNDE